MFRVRRRGIALVLSMLIATLLIMLMGAFFQLNRDNLVTYSISQKQRQALLAAQSGIAYVRGRLENDQSFANPVVSTDREFRLGPMLVTERAGSSVVNGTFPGDPSRSGHGFEVEIYNNLDPLGSGRPVRGRYIPKDAARLKATGYAGGFKATLDVVMGGEPLYDAAAVANGGIDMSPVQSWTVTSKDPKRNWIRSNGDIWLRDVVNTDPASSPVQFQYNDPLLRTRGMLWAKGDIRSASERLEGASLSTAMRNVGAQIAPRSTLRNNIFKLKQEDLRLQGVDAAASARTIPAGRYVLSEVEVRIASEAMFGRTYSAMRTLKTVTYIDPDGVRRQTWYDSGQLDGIIQEVEDDAGIFFAQDLRENGISESAITINTPTIAGGIPVQGGEIVLNAAGGGGFKFNFANNSFSLEEGKRFEVEGNFDIGFETLREGISQNVQVDFPQGTSAAALIVNGDVDIRGTVEGRAAIAATGPVQFSARADVQADQRLPVVVYSQEDVTIRAINLEDANNPNLNFSMRGLIYSDKNVNVWTPPSLRLDNMTYSGAIVAQNGQIRFGAGQDQYAPRRVRFEYDPQLILDLTKNLRAATARRRLKQVTYQVH